MKKFLALAMSAMMILGVAGCGSSSSKEEKGETQKGEVTDNEDGKVIKMGCSADFPPMEYYADDATTIIGFDADLMQEICDRLGMELKIIDMNFDSVVTAVQTGKIDVGVTGITITDERKENVNFSDPYFEASQSILVSKDSPIKGYEDLISGDYKVAVQLGTTGDIMASEKMGDKVSKFEKYGDALAALMSGKVDCMVLDTGVAKAYAKVNDLMVLDEKFGDAEDIEYYGIAVAKENTELLESINKTLAEMEEEGFIDQLNAKYAG